MIMGTDDHNQAETARSAEPGLVVETSLERPWDRSASGVPSQRDAASAPPNCSWRCIRRARSVVIRDREPAQDAHRIVVGVDASDHPVAALGSAFDEASVRGVPLHAVHTWTDPASTGPGGHAAAGVRPGCRPRGETRLLAELLAGWSEKYPDVQVPDRWRGLVPAMRCWWRPAGPSCW